MSKIKVKVNNPSNGQYRLVELESRAPSLARVDAEARRKFGVNSSLQFLFRLQSGTHMAVNSDADLQRACTESCQAKRPFVDLELSGPGAHQAAAAHSQSQQAYSAPAQPAYHAPAHQQPAYQQPAQPAYDPSAAANRSMGTNRAAAPAAASASTSVGANTIVHVQHRGVPGAPEKMKVVARQEDDCYVFVPEPASLDTLVEVELPSTRQLVFRLTSATSKLTQTFNMPFDVNRNNLSVKGANVVLMFDW